MALVEELEPMAVGVVEVDAGGIAGAALDRDALVSKRALVSS